MGSTSIVTSSLLLLTVVLVLFPVETYAFGAGDIPDFAYLNDKAFRHGDIENILETLVKSAGGAATGGFLGFSASALIRRATGGAKFNKGDVKKVYFGNWLRDYSQAMDIGGLSKLSADTLILVVAVLGFMTFGFASEEFEVTADRLGVYLPVEHIDNPKGYAEKEGDARAYHPKLRPPVNPRELEIDSNTGMKKYIATEGHGWDTSTAFIRRTFRACIEHGRRANGHEGAELWEAYRLMGTGLHTMEDLLAHTNWCELALRKMGYEEVFCHVGDSVLVDTPNGPAPPLVTGTFGGADFLHSLLGETGDKLSQASVTDLSHKISETSSGNGPDIGAIKNILGKFGGGNDSDLDHGEQLKAESKAYHFDPNNVCPPDVQKKLMDLLKWHDNIMRSIEEKIEMVPGLSSLLDQLSNDLNTCWYILVLSLQSLMDTPPQDIYTVLAPYIGPILSEATSALDSGSKAVIQSDDQYEVFNNPRAHDPSHSQLSKDHFGLILNEPAGKIAQIVVVNSVELIVPAWSNNSDPDEVIDRILEAFHHPYYAVGHSAIQNKMFDHMQRWVGELGDEANEIISLLTKESVREHRNKRPGLPEEEEAGYGGCGHGGHGSSGGGGGGFGQIQSLYGQFANSGGDEYEGGPQETFREQSYTEENEGSYQTQRESSYSYRNTDQEGGYTTSYESNQYQSEGYAPSTGGGYQSSYTTYREETRESWGQEYYQRSNVEEQEYTVERGEERDETFGMEELNVREEGGQEENYEEEPQSNQYEYQEEEY
ncbi:hypothetical protein D9619_007668 [Psilocybe cf. subviscida]|uniref:Heterokaryon incompatibility protein HET-C n=1 Tax=Psilocybe cf. subviscida TaxID=2480587 RepID=A0A8H5ESG1_9AGAR|nr:hypothetical protein D9619_007668 [Psilocybe cf. subviscida]